MPCSCRRSAVLIDEAGGAGTAAAKLTLGFLTRSPGASPSWNAASPGSKRLSRHYGPSEPPTSSQKPDPKVRLVLGVVMKGLSGKGSQGWGGS